MYEVQKLTQKSQMSKENEQKERQEKNTYSQTSRLEYPEQLQLHIKPRKNPGDDELPLEFSASLAVGERNLPGPAFVSGCGAAELFLWW
jgi:hypothetical protein